MKASVRHMCTSFTANCASTEEVLKQQLRRLQAKTEELKSAAAQNAQTMTEIEAAQTQAKQTSQQLRAALHEDVDEYFDVIDERIKKFCQQYITAVSQRSRDRELEKFRKLTTEMDKLLKEQDSKILAEAEELVSTAQKLLKSLDDVTYVDVNIPRVILKRNPNFSLESAVDLKLHEVVAHKPRVIYQFIKFLLLIGFFICV